MMAYAFNDGDDVLCCRGAEGADQPRELEYHASGFGAGNADRQGAEASTSNDAEIPAQYIVTQAAIQN